MKDVTAKLGDKALKRCRELIQEIAKFGESESIDNEPVLFTQHLHKIMEGLGILDWEVKLIELGFLKLRDRDPESWYIILEPTPNRELGVIARKVCNKIEPGDSDNLGGFRANFTRGLPGILKKVSDDPEIMTKLIAAGYIVIRSVMVHNNQPTSWYVCRTLEESEKLRAALAKQIIGA